jgi:hypothetical protein
VIQLEQTQLSVIRATLEEQKTNGNRWVTYPVQDSPLGLDDLRFFSASYDALEHCYEQSTDFDQWAVKTVDELKTITFQNSITMKQENFDYLKEQVKYTGFGDTLESQLREKMEKGGPDFQLTHQHKFGKDEANAVLHFRYAENSGNYYFNSYDLSVKNHKGEQQGTQKFYIGKDNNFTLKEGYNLLSGRSVNKDLVNKANETYNAWVKLDFKETDGHENFKMKHFTKNYGFNLDEALAKHPIKDLQDTEGKRLLLESLKKGNRQQVTFLSDNGEVKGYVEANPQFKSVTVYDQNYKRVNQAQSNSQGKEQTEEQSLKAKPKVADDATDAPKKNKKKAVSHKV